MPRYCQNALMRQDDRSSLNQLIRSVWLFTVPLRVMTWVIMEKLFRIRQNAS